MEQIMKNSLKIIISLFLISLSIPIIIVSADSNISRGNNFRGLWVATVLNMDYPSKPTVDVETLKNEAIEILDNAKDIGFNAVFLQVRPSSDSFYKSEIVPWSKYLTGKQGLMPNDNFDPLEFWITEAHKRGIELHAWINPYRVTKNSDDEPSYNFASLASSNPARINPNWVVKYSDGDLYFDPGIPEVRKLIIDSVVEIIQNYDVDGIHLDDYFYPGNDFNDKATYKKYGARYKNIGDWRRANVNTLIGDLSKAIKDNSEDVRFGISPFGIWANKSSNSLGSDTQGMQSYYDHYADTRKWVKDGLVDYIAPQIYWNIGYSIADYSKLLSWWNDLVSGTGVDLYIGQAAYRTGNPDPSSPWYGVSEIEKQLNLNAKTSEVKGSIFFNYTPLKENPALSTVIKAMYEQQDGIIPKIPVGVSRPSENIRTSFEEFYLNGSSDPDKPLFLNGEPVEDRSNLGYFGILVPLDKGENIFTISQEASYVTRVIYRETANEVPEKMKEVGIPTSSTFPGVQEYGTPGEEITLSCQAPIGSKVTVKIGGKSFTMKPSTTTSPGSGVYPATFTYVYTIPTYAGTPRNIDLGAPTYTMNYKGILKTCSAPAKVGAIMKNSPFYAKVIKEVIDTYKTPDSSDGAAYELYKGMFDYVTGMTGSYVRLSSGQWVKQTSVETYTSKSQLHAVIKKAVYKTGEKWDTLKLDISLSVAAIASFDESTLKLNISTAISSVLPKLPSDSLFSSVVVSRGNNKAQYIFTLKENQRIEGYYIEKTPAGLTLHIKRPVQAKGGDKPLADITIMLDPGHGGSETGAIGPLGLNYPEKTINLNTSIKLQKELKNLGAKVLMTRTTDKDLSLYDRLAASRDAKPDMFISLHANSMEDNVDISKIDGISVFYRDAFTKPLSELMLNNTTEALNRNNQGINVRDFYVIRGTWTPSILIESGFVPNPNEFEWLTDENVQSLLAKSISDAIVKYFE
jgi:uncharacterized lipoprotein YddW (UPF0748 family)/N-acetylmuramoyl-L-alanine amidase